MLVQDPYTGEYYDDGQDAPQTGGGYQAPPDGAMLPIGAWPDGSPKYPGQTHQVDRGAGMAPMAWGPDQNAHIDTWLKELLARPATDAERAEAARVYQMRGGDVMREYIVGLRGEGAGGFVWPSMGGFSEQYSAGEYQPQQFQEQFAPPTVEDMLKDPGYRVRMDEMQRGTERMAAAKGSVLSGGFVGRTLPRVLGEHASQEYGNTFKRAYDQYQSRYGQFSDSQDRAANAFAMNETGKLNQYQTRYTSYRDLVRDRQLDDDARWQREMDLARLGLSSASAGG